MKVSTIKRALLFPLAAVVMAGCASASAGNNPVPWHNYSSLASYPTDRPFLVIKCTFSDATTVPTGLDDQIQTFLTLKGIGTGNMLDYYNDVSYGAISMAGNHVTGWYKAPFTQASLGGANNRGERVKECANAAPDNAVDFSRYYGIIMVTNVQNDGGACWTGQSGMEIHNQTYNVGCVVFDPNSLFTDFAGHEIGHALGFPHSWDNIQDHPCGNQTPGEYGDTYDIMSAMCTSMFAGANDYNPNKWKGYDGPGVNGPNLLAQNWIPSTRIETYTGGAQTFVLNALSHPIGFGALAVKIVPDPSQPTNFYTIEYRQKDGWDAGIDNNAVLIHQVKGLPSLPATNTAPFSYLLYNANNNTGQWLQGDAWTDAADQLQVTVTSIDPSSGTATITIGFPSLFSTAPAAKILAPSNLTHVYAHSSFSVVSNDTTFSGTPIPDADVRWTANGVPIGTGKVVTASLSQGIYSVTVTATDRASGKSATDTIALYVDPQAPSPTPIPTAGPTASPTSTPLPAPPSAIILSPTVSSDYPFAQYNGSFSLTVSAQGSSGVTTYAWSDDLGLLTDSRANDTLTVTATMQQVGCRSTTDVIHLKVADAFGQTAVATPVSITLYRECIQ